MAQSRLARASVCASLLVAGALAEAAARGQTDLLAAADYMVGAGFAIGAVWLRAAERSLGLLSTAVAATWFAGTLSIALPALPVYAGDVAVLAYRGVLVHLFVRALSPRRATFARRVLIVAGYLAVAPPAPVAGLISAVMMTTVATVAAAAARHAQADHRSFLRSAALAAAAVSGVWWLAAGGVSGPGIQVGNDVVLLAAAAMFTVRADPSARLHGAISSLVVDLGPSRRPGAPVSALLASVLADPDLEVRYAAPGLHWFDEEGNPVNAPADERGSRLVTRAAVPGGGEVALLHGAPRAAGPELAQAAAQAAALALASARLNAEVRRQSSAVRESRRRLLTAADAERQALEEQLRAGAIGMLRQVDESLAGVSGETAASIRKKLAIALDDLARLARGLFPGALAEHSVDLVLREMTEGMPLPVGLVTRGPISEMPEPLQALCYFFFSECLANVAVHAKATAASAELLYEDGNLTMTVLDNGRGGASVAGPGGLQGLADRIQVAGGVLSVSSPPAGPTCVRAAIAISAGSGRVSVRTLRTRDTHDT